ncbi:MAG: HAMP domain-containing protein [Planctomycetes bacterium]|nr:HAMP domain-containing protein [Planctomycetota bacterium]
MPAAEHPPAARPWSRLALRLAAAMGLLLIALGAVLNAFVVPRTAQAFADHGTELLQEGAAVMRDLARQRIAATRTVLIDLISHTATSRQAALRDLPVDLHQGDADGLRAAIETADRERAARQQHNTRVLADEMQRRATAQIDGRLHELAADQERRTAAFAADLRTTHVSLLVAALALALAVLGAGLHFLVVRPVSALRRATQRIAAGDLAIDAPPARNDEIGDLARDFERMATELRHSRAALQAMADGLEAEVQRQTGHLERALADLRASHDQLAQAERLAALGTLAGGIAHEFHNVIGGIRGCAEELREEEQDADRRETLAVITRAADRATGIVQQLLRFARHAVAPSAEVDLATVAADAVRLCEPAARRQGVRIERDLPAGALVHGDADALHQVFVNLCTNALQAMPEGGRLRLTLRADAGGARIEVADTGVGIAAADLPRVFEPFFTTRSGERDQARRGTGLGLSVSYGIVAAHGGRLEVTSVPGQGTTFVVWLPRRSPAAG